MRRVLAIFALAATAACSGSSTAPSALTVASVNTFLDISGTWSGLLQSTNGTSVAIGVQLTEKVADVSGTWASSALAWSGNVTGAVSGNSFSGQFTFTGTTSQGIVCTATAAVSGPASTSSMSLTSADGFIGATCPAQLPVGVRIDLYR